MSEATQNIELTPRQQALIRVIRGIQNGVIEELVIRKGEPVVIKAGIQRIDLDKSDERDVCLELDKDLSRLLVVDFEAPKPPGWKPPSGLYLRPDPNEQKEEAETPEEETDPQKEQNESGSGETKPQKGEGEKSGPKRGEDGKFVKGGG